MNLKTNKKFYASNLTHYKIILPEITSLSPLGVSSSLGWAVAKLRFDFHAICDKVCQFPAAGRRFPPGTPVSSANKTDRHEITHMVLHQV